MDEAERVRGQIESCDACGLGEEANRVPFGGVSWRPKLVLLGEGPGKQEDLQGEPFVGRAGALLNRILKMAGLSRNEVLIANTVCCRPPGNRDPEWSEIEACKGNREAQIELANTWVGVVMGRVALGALLEDPGKSIGQYKGKPMWVGNMVWVPAYHPAYALRNKGAVAEIASHVKVALDIYQGKMKAPRPPKPGKYWMERGCLIVDHDGVKVPLRVRELAKATFTKEEWMRLNHAGTERLVTRTIEVATELDVEVT